MDRLIVAYRGQKTLLKILPAAIMMGLAPCVYAGAVPTSPALSTSQQQSRGGQSQNP